MLTPGAVKSVQLLHHPLERLGGEPACIWLLGYALVHKLRAMNLHAYYSLATVLRSPASFVVLGWGRQGASRSNDEWQTTGLTIPGRHGQMYFLDTYAVACAVGSLHICHPQGQLRTLA